MLPAFLDVEAGHSGCSVFEVGVVLCGWFVPKFQRG